MLFHVSEAPGIERFEPRPSSYTTEPVVWAIDEAHLRNYLLPRDCPRVTYYAGAETTGSDVERFLGSSDAVVAVEAAWLERIRACRLHCYHLPPATFERIDACAGYFVSRTAVAPVAVDVYHDVMAALLKDRVELRFVPSLWPLRDAVAASTLMFSMICMRNASSAALTRP
jgi:uncharacterized protein DUF6886